MLIYPEYEKKKTSRLSEEFIINQTMEKIGLWFLSILLELGIEWVLSPSGTEGQARPAMTFPGNE